METDPTQPGFDGKHPTLAELRSPASHPHISHHVETCSMCRAIMSGDHSTPIPLDLPKGLVSEVAFRWPADPMARGGMAQIFAGEDRRLGRPVILKAPREGDELPAGMAEMFQRRVTAEARILAKLQHPSIVTIYELGKASVGWPFCVLQRVEGDALRDRLDELAEEERDGEPRTRERLELLSSLVSIAEALAYAHERHVVHRDCTPNNILLGKRGEATLIDWGIARDLDAPGDGGPTDAPEDDRPSKSGRMVTISAGTPPYLPLEQSAGPPGATRASTSTASASRCTRSSPGARRSSGTTATTPARAAPPARDVPRLAEDRRDVARRRCRAIRSCPASSRARWRTNRA